MLFFVKWKYLLKAARTCARWCTLLETPTRRRKLCCRTMTKYNEVNCVDKLTWCETLILSRRWSS